MHPIGRDLMRTVTEGATHTAGSHEGPSVLRGDPAKTLGINSRTFSQRQAQLAVLQQQRALTAMASVYKTLSGADSHEKETGEKKNKQRVLILVNIHVSQQRPC